MTAEASNPVSDGDWHSAAHASGQKPDETEPDWPTLCGPWTGPQPGRGRRVLSLYSGAGGLDRGFLDAGFEIAHAIESDPHAVATYRSSIGDNVICGELPSALKQIPGPRSFAPDVIIGGPPCQGFSVHGRQDPGDPRSRHVHVFLDAVRAYQPAAFCMENVKALATGSRWQPVYHGLLERARQLNYSVAPFLLNASDFTVPQARERVFLIGVRDGSPVAPAAPTHNASLTVLQALAALPPYRAHGNNTECTARVVLAKNPVMRPSPYRGSLLFNGSGRPLELNAVARTLPASMGGNGTPIIDQLELEARLLDPSASVESWIQTHHARLLAGLPEPKGEHPLRRITVEEAAALQSFPPDWDWKGPRNARFRQIGNAVPPRLARYVALAVGHALETRAAGTPAPEPRRRLSYLPRSATASSRWRRIAA